MSKHLLLAAFAAASLAACDNDPTATAPFLLPTPPSADFGRRSALAEPIVKGILIQNTGGSPSAPLTATLEGPGKAGFVIEPAGSNCVGRRLAPGASCNVVVSMSGQASGPVSATLVVGGTGDEDQRAVVALTGVIESKLNVYYQGVGHGFITESAHGTSCVATCTLTLDVPTVTLTALPDPQSTFAGWTGVPGCGTSASCTMTLIDLNAVTVRFDPI